MQNKYGLSKNIWLIFNNEDKIKINYEENYIPYNCQFLVVKNLAHNYIVEEIYDPFKKSNITFHSFLGIWSKNKGLDDIESDFYKRRFDMNKTTFIAFIYVRTCLGSKSLYRA